MSNTFTEKYKIFVFLCSINPICVYTVIGFLRLDFWPKWVRAFPHFDISFVWEFNRNKCVMATVLGEENPGSALQIILLLVLLFI